MRNKKTIVITGAGSGIGRDAAFALHERGHHVIATTETEEQAAVLRTLIGANSSLQVHKLDITLPADRESMRTFDADVLINNAGIGESGSLAEVPMDRVRKNFEVNVFAALELTQIALEGIMRKRKGTVIFVSSLAGRTVTPFLNPYSMTKHALSGGLAATRRELHRVAPRVHICLVEPGAYHTGFNQRMSETKYEWMNESSYFYRLIPKLKLEDAQSFGLLEQKSTASIVRKIVRAAESRAPRLRYVAPWYQGCGVYLMRMVGM